MTLAGIKLGSVVTLKSGCPKMTVIEQDRSDGWGTTLTWRCRWFEGNELKELSFPAAALKESP